MGFSKTRWRYANWFKYSDSEGCHCTVLNGTRKTVFQRCAAQIETRNHKKKNFSFDPYLTSSTSDWPGKVDCCTCMPLIQVRFDKHWASEARRSSRFESTGPPCSTRAAVRRRCGESQPSLHWKGLLFIARASRIYGPRAAQRARGIARSESLHGLSYASAEGPRQAGPASWAAAVAATVRCVAGYGRRELAGRSQGLGTAANFLFPGLSGNILSSFGPNGRLFGTNFAGTGSVGVYPFSRKKPGNISFKICW